MNSYNPNNNSNLRHDEYLHAEGSVGHNTKAYNENALQIEDKVAHLSLQVNQIIIRPYLQQALDYLKVSRHDAEIAYNTLSDEIAQEVKLIQVYISDTTDKIEQSKAAIETTQHLIRNKYNNATEEEITNGLLNLDPEYNRVADEYENVMRWSQEVTKYRMRIESLIESQEILDNSVIARTSDIQIEIDNLDLLLHNFDSSNYADFFASRKGLTNNGANPTQRAPERYKDLQNMVSNIDRTYSEHPSNVTRSETPYYAPVDPRLDRGVQGAVGYPQPAPAPQAQPVLYNEPQQYAPQPAQVPNYAGLSKKDAKRQEKLQRRAGYAPVPQAEESLPTKVNPLQNQYR